MIMVPSAEGLIYLGPLFVTSWLENRPLAQVTEDPSLGRCSPVWTNQGQIGGCQSQLRATWSGSSL